MQHQSQYAKRLHRFLFSQDVHPVSYRRSFPVEFLLFLKYHLTLPYSKKFNELIKKITVNTNVDLAVPLPSNDAFPAPPCTFLPCAFRLVLSDGSSIA